MALEVYTANGITYTIAPDADVPPGARPQAVIGMVLEDELNGLAPAGPIRIDSPFPGLTPRTGLGGLAGFAGIPARLFSELASQDYDVPVEIEADGYLAVSRAVKFPKTPGFPGVFTPAALGAVSLHRQPVIVYGRAVVNSSGGVAPAAGASVTMTGLWRTLPPANAIVAPDPPNVVSLNPPLYFDRGAAATQVAGLDFLGAPGPDKRLLADATAGQSQLRSSDCLAVSVADILAIDVADPALTEFIAIQSIAKSGADALPATITLSYPLRYTHRRNAVVHKVAFQPPGPPTALAQDAITGDCCTFLTAPGNLGASPLVEVQGGGSPTEYHSVSRFAVTCDSQGFFRLPPLSRVAQCVLRAHDGVHTDIDLTVAPDYSPEGSRVDFAFQ